MINNSIFKKIYRKKTIKKYEDKFKLLGSNVKLKYIDFLNIRFFGTLIIFILLLLFNDKGFIYAPICSLAFFISLDYLLESKIRTRCNKLNYEAIFYFQVLVLTLESGKNLQGGLELTCKSIDSEISNEFKKTLNEMKLGKTLNESLISMKSRIPSEEINTVLLNIREATIFGNNIIESLNNQIEYLRDKKMLSIKAKINKMPMKISVVSVIFIIPIVLLLVLGPVIINFIMNG